MARFNYVTSKDIIHVSDLKPYEIKGWEPYTPCESTALLVKEITKIKCGPVHTMECGEVLGYSNEFYVRDPRHPTYAIATVSTNAEVYKVRSYAIHKQRVSRHTYDYHTAETKNAKTVVSLLKQIPVITKEAILEMLSTMGMRDANKVRGTQKETRLWLAFNNKVKDPTQGYTTDSTRTQILCSAMCDMFKAMQHTAQSFADIQHKYPEIANAFLSATAEVNENKTHALGMADKVNVVVQKHRSDDSVYCTVHGHGTFKFRSPADVPAYIQGQVATIESIAPQELPNYQTHTWVPLEGVGAKFFKQNVGLDFLEAAYLVFMDKTYVEQPHWFLHAEKISNDVI